GRLPGPDAMLVPKGGLEPPRPKPLPPQGSASTNSATWALNAECYPAGTGSSTGGVASPAGASPTGSSSSGACSTGAAGTVGAAGTCGAASAGTAGTSAITPRSGAPARGIAELVAYQAMYRLITKKVIASHLVAFDRKFPAPVEPKTVAEAPAPKPEPAAAPAPRCMRISAIIAMATRT